MKSIIKIIMFPFALIIDLVTWICIGVLSCSAFVFALAGTILGILALAVLLTSSVTNGLILFVFAFLIGPMGLPMLAAWILSGLQRVSLAIKGI